MGRVLTGNVWINDVYYAAGTDEAGTGDAAGLIGDHLWSEDGAAVAAPSPAGESRFAAVEEGPSPFTSVDPDNTPAVESAADVPEPVVVPGEFADAPAEVPVPPKGGKGSSAAHWADYARANGVDVEPGSNRDDIIDQLSEAGIATE